MRISEILCKKIPPLSISIENTEGGVFYTLYKMQNATAVQHYSFVLRVLKSL